MDKAKYESWMKIWRHENYHWYDALSINILTALLLLYLGVSPALALIAFYKTYLVVYLLEMGLKWLYYGEYYKAYRNVSFERLAYHKYDGPFNWIPFEWVRYIFKKPKSYE